MLNFKIRVKPLLSQTDLGGAGSDLVLEIGPLAQNRAAFQGRILNPTSEPLNCIQSLRKTRGTSHEEPHHDGKAATQKACFILCPYPKRRRVMQKTSGRRVVRNTVDHFSGPHLLVLGNLGPCS